MRITQQMTLRNALRGLSGNRDALDRAHLEVTTGRRLLRPSDEPIDTATVLKLESSLRATERFRRGAVTAETRLHAEDAVLSAVEDLLRQAKELASSSYGDDALRQAAADQLGRLSEQIISLANTQVGGDYIFSGSKIDTSPYLGNGSYVGNDVVTEIEVGDGLRVPTNHTGDRVFGQILSAIDQMVFTLTSEPSDSAPDVGDLNAAMDTLRRSRAEVGSRLRQVDEVQKYLVQRTATTEDHRAALTDADTAESILRMSQAQNTLETAYAALGRLLSTNLLDYLK